MDEQYDVVVVGGGVAGLSAAMMLGRSRRRVVVVDAGEPRNAPSAHLHGFLSRDGMDPAELLSTARREVVGYGGELLTGRVVGIDRLDGARFAVRLAEGGRLGARAVVVATGSAMSSPRSRACVSGGARMCIFARTATATRYATARWE